jgi:hypothetical protein
VEKITPLLFHRRLRPTLSKGSVFEAVLEIGDLHIHNCREWTAFEATSNAEELANF